MTQRELARQTGISRQSISDIYNEININININKFDKLCEVLECDICDLLVYIPNERLGKETTKKKDKK